MGNRFINKLYSKTSVMLPEGFKMYLSKKNKITVFYCLNILIIMFKITAKDINKEPEIP